MSKKVDCIHLEGKDECKLRIGSCGWNGEYCGLAIFGDGCGERIPWPLCHKCKLKRVEREGYICQNCG